MVDEIPRFTSESRGTDRASWASEEDWLSGLMSGVDVVDGSVAPRASTEVPVPSGGILLEGFERDSPLDIYQGDRGDFTESTTSVFNGDRALYSRGGPSTGVNVIATDALDRLPKRGERFSYWLLDGGDMRQRFLFGCQNVAAPRENTYELLIDSVNSVLRLAKYRNGGVVLDEVVDVTLPGSGWVEPGVRWSDSGAIVVSLYDSSGLAIATVSVDDAEWDTGAIGWGEHQLVANWWVDDLRLWEVGV